MYQQLIDSIWLTASTKAYYPQRLSSDVDIFRDRNITYFQDEPIEVLNHPIFAQFLVCQHGAPRLTCTHPLSLTLLACHCGLVQVSDSHGSTRPPLGGGIAPPWKNYAPPWRSQGGACAPPWQSQGFFQYLKALGYFSLTLLITALILVKLEVQWEYKCKDGF